MAIVDPQASAQDAQAGALGYQQPFAAQGGLGNAIAKPAPALNDVLGAAHDHLRLGLRIARYTCISPRKPFGP